MKELTEKQKEMLDFIKSFNNKNGYPPTVKEIMDHFRFASPTSVTTQLAALCKKGYIKKLDGRARGIVPINHSKISKEELDYSDRFVNIPVLDNYVKAGTSMMVADEQISEILELPRSIAKDDNMFCMKVKGDSMIEAHIQEDDLLLIKKTNAANNGDIIVAKIDTDEGQEITIKRFFQDEYNIRLMPENKNYEPIICDNIEIVGKVVSVFRLNIN